MKKILLHIILSFFGVLVILSTPSAISAKGGTHTCRFSLASKDCVATTAGCNKGYEPNKTKCSSIETKTKTGRDKCQNARINCLLSRSPGTTGISLAQDPTCDGVGIDTAIGCIPYRNPTKFVAFILRWAMGIGGGIAFLLIVFSGFRIMTSSGNPEVLKAAQESLTSAVSGLILLILSVFILRVIGVDIIGIPGFN